MTHPKNNYFYRSILTVLIVILLSSTGCSASNEKNSAFSSSQNAVRQTASSTDSILTVNDINEGIEFVQNYLNAYKDGDMEKIKALYFPDYYPERTNEYFKSKKNLTIKRVSYPAVYLKDYDVANKYKSKHKADVYKSLILYAEYEENGKHTENDFVLIKQKSDSQWVIYDNGK